MNHIRGICRSSARQRLSHGAAEPPTSMVCYHTLLSLRELGRRAQFPGAQLERLDELIVPLVTARALGLLRLTGSARTPPPSC